jgi:hypothetical protein
MVVFCVSHPCNQVLTYANFAVSMR